MIALLDSHRDTDGCVERRSAHAQRRRVALSTRFTVVLGVAITLLAVGPEAAGQEAAPPTPAPTRVAAGPDGVVLESGNGDFRLQIGALIHFDSRFALDDEGGRVDDTFALRRVRPYLRGRLSRRFEFFVNPDFAGGALVLQDAYLDTIV